jgi:hypothetical protein
MSRKKIYSIWNASSNPQINTQYKTRAENIAACKKMSLVNNDTYEVRCHDTASDTTKVIMTCHAGSIIQNRATLTYMVDGVLAQQFVAISEEDLNTLKAARKLINMVSVSINSIDVAVKVNKSVVSIVSVNHRGIYFIKSGESESLWKELII